MVFCHSPSFTSRMKDATLMSEIEQGSKDIIVIRKVMFKKLADLIKLSLIDWLIVVARL